MGRGHTDLREHKLGERRTISGVQIEAMKRQLFGSGGRSLALVDRDLLASMLQEIAHYRLHDITLPTRSATKSSLAASSEPPS